MRLESVAASLVLLPAIAVAQAPTETRPRCPARDEVRLPEALDGARFAAAGDEVIAIPGNDGRLHRMRGCNGRFSPVGGRLRFAPDQVHAVGDALVITGGGGTAIYRRGRVRPLSPAISPSASVAVSGAELAFVGPQRAGILDVRHHRLAALPPHANLLRSDALVALDDARVFVLGGGAPGLVLDRATGAWTVAPTLPDLDYTALVATDVGAVRIGTERTSFRTQAHAYDAATNTWRELPLPGATRGRVERTWRHGGHTVVQVVEGSDHRAWLLDRASLAWQPVDGSARGGRLVDGGPVFVGVQAPSPRARRYPAAAVDPTASRWRHATIPELPRNAHALFLAGQLIVIQPAEHRPTGWRSVGCEGPREPGMPACDPMEAPTGSRRVPGELSIAPLAWQ